MKVIAWPCADIAAEVLSFIALCAASAADLIIYGATVPFSPMSLLYINII